MYILVSFIKSGIKNGIIEIDDKRLEWNAKRESLKCFMNIN
jgi:hypothetical protein